MAESLHLPKFSVLTSRITRGNILVHWRIKPIAPSRVRRELPPTSDALLMCYILYADTVEMSRDSAQLVTKFMFF